MQIIDFDTNSARPVTEYDSVGASAQPLADGSGEAHVYVVHLEPGGSIGLHPAGFGQLFLVIAGAAWIADGHGMRHVVRAGQGAVIARGEMHAKGSGRGCSAVMIQLAELTPAVVPRR